ncbi:two-component system sensor histidine kinase NtrB [Desulfovibrio ferrophilus]|uniref:histidine kinase n=1 Tax=Desulfovibrio ferrophilus TaxID=241368 RepID=A0A2Z6B394_9BACT|nr:ATP-binding protein [Desulfovibrio ferrophilus]BBD09915.1 PAS/PAC sensor signal transduction histidine kinase [Desulfovibrio ferrophilus]
MQDIAKAGPECLVAIGGSGPELMQLLEMFDCQDIREGFPWMRLVGVVDGTTRPEVSGALALSRVRLFSTVGELLSAHPEVDIVFDLHATPERSRALRGGLPEGVSVVDARAAMVFWEMIMSGKICAPCQSNLHQARAFLTTVLDGMEEDILLLDLEGRIVDCNRNVTTRLGQPKSAFQGRYCHEVEGGSFCRRSRRECPFRETVMTGKKAEAVHTKLDDDGRLLYFRVYTYPLFNELSELINVVEIRRDITSRTYTEQRLQQAQKMAAIGELSTYIAHEIRNPLFAIGGFARSLLRAENLDEEAQGKVKIILEEASRLDGILKSILNYARPSDTKAGEVDVNSVVGETVQLMSIGCDQEGIRIKTNLDSKVARAKGVPELLKQCLINMVKNSMEAMESGKGCITLFTGMEDEYVIVRVEDTGRGMADDVKLKVFNPFFSTKDKGSGLGLAMTKKIVEDVGGRISLSSHEGVGTVVTLFLPPVLAVDGDTLDAEDIPA